MSSIRIAPEELQKFLTQVFAKAGMPQADAEFSAWATVQSDLWGIDSHGTLRSSHYEMRLRTNAVNPRPKIVNKLAPELPVAHLDADAALGYVAGRDGMNLAIEKAKKHGISFVVVSNSNHYGAAGLYARMGAAEGLLSLSTTNVKPNIATVGALATATGNNPIALAAPMPDRDAPFCIDVAMSLVALGKLIFAAKTGKEIPSGWALDKNGEETRDPKAGIDGILLPVGDHKGFGLSLFVDIVTGLLGGGTFLTQLVSMYSAPDRPSDLAHAFACLNPDLFLSRDEYLARMGQWLELLKAVPVKPGRAALTMPGEPEIAMERERRAAGIPIPDALWEDLVAMADRHGLVPPARR